MRKVINMNMKMYYISKFEEGWTGEELMRLVDDNLALSIKMRCQQLTFKDVNIISSTPKELIQEIYSEWCNGKSGRVEEVDNRMGEIRSLLEEGYTQKEIMLKTGYTRRLVSEVTKAWVKDGNTEVKETKQKGNTVKEVESKKAKKMSKKCLAKMQALEEKRLLELKQKEEEGKKVEKEEVKDNVELVEEKSVEKKEQEEVVFNKNGIPKGKRMTLKEYGEACGYNKEKAVEPVEEKREVVVHVEECPGGIKKDMTDYKRGDVVFVYNDAYSRNNGIIGKSRPALIVQNDSGNFYSDNVIVCYITSVLKKHNLPTHVYSTDTECLRDSMIMTEQIQTVSKQFITYMGRISEKEMIEVEKALVVSFGLSNYIGSLIEKECHRRGKLDLELVGYEMLKASGEVACIEEEVQEPVVEEVKEKVQEQVGVIKTFKGLKVNELESDKYTYRIDRALEITRKEKGQTENVIADIDSVIKDLMEIKNYLLNQ